MKLGLILGDQLSEDLPLLQQLHPQHDALLMAEVHDEATYAWHHKQKLILIFSAMRHFARQLRAKGWQVHYIYYEPDSAALGLLDALTQTCQKLNAKTCLVTEPGEYRLQHAMTSQWQASLPCALTVLEDTRFLCSHAQFAQWAQGRQQLRMEYFYRDMRRRFNLLMDNGQPVGGQWNFDQDNRKKFDGSVPLPPRLEMPDDPIVNDVRQLIDTHFPDHPGSSHNFDWPVTREQALLALTHFIDHALPHFGDFQDAMLQDEPTLFHSRLSASLNIGLLQPLEVCQAAETAWQQGRVPLNAAEGFIRQILGWREYVRGIYWLQMPAYADLNHWQHDRPLPAFYWTGETGMHCMRQAISQTLESAYAHHIQRLMITGNFALLAGLLPQAVCHWYLSVYSDAFEWVELPNTLGMALHADGGLMASKPYAASGAYIHRMSDYCRHCRYQVKTNTESDSCPFNSLYWHFIQRHESQLRNNPRMTMIYKNLDRMSDAKKQALVQRADFVLEHIDEL